MDAVEPAKPRAVGFQVPRPFDHPEPRAQLGQELGDGDGVRPVVGVDDSGSHFVEQPVDDLAPQPQSGDVRRLVASADEHDGPAPLRDERELVEQPRLADAGFARHRDHATGAGRCSGVSARQAREVTAAPEERVGTSGREPTGMARYRALFPAV